MGGDGNGGRWRGRVGRKREKREEREGKERRKRGLISLQGIITMTGNRIEWR
jgi:hypothetical protein